MFGPDADGAAPADRAVQLPQDQLQQLALDFSKHILEEVFTPAQIQGYLLNYRDSPVDAAAKVEQWVQEEVRMIEAAKEKERKAAESKKKKRKERKRRKAAKLAEAMRDYDSDEDLEELRQRMKEEKKKKKKKDQEEEAEKAEGKDDTENQDKTENKGKEKGEEEAASEKPDTGNAAPGKTPNGVSEDNIAVEKPAKEEVNAADVNGAAAEVPETKTNGVSGGH
jgi:chaperone BCS1